MYFAVNDDKQVYEVIDGQQRLTTTHLLLRVLMEHLEDVDPDSIEDDTLAEFGTTGSGESPISSMWRNRSANVSPGSR